MNLKYTFQIAAYRANTTSPMEVIQVSATGSQETRARRRLIEHLHGKGIFAKSVELLATEKAR